MANRKFTAVEGLRFLLFLGVFFFHCSFEWFSMSWGGGVQAFLVIGSFFMTCKYLDYDKSEIKIGKSFLHRVKRLYPVYIIIIIGVMVIFTIRKSGIVKDALWYVFVLQNFRCLFDGVGKSLESLLGHFWYIGLDLWLFFIWIMLLKFIPQRRLKAVFIASLCFGLLWRTFFIVVCQTNLSISYVIPLGQLDCWAIGGLLALNVRNKGLNERMMWTDILVGIVGILLMVAFNALRNHCDYYSAYKLFSTASGYMDSPLLGNVHLFKGILAAGLLRYCIDTNKKHVILSSRPLVALGGMTYELYCFHLPMISVSYYVIKNKIIMAFTALIATYLVSLLWCKFIDPLVKKVMR
jgi:peptidoglycan/LPS O-acetylase OafA/YrhL